MMTNILLKKRFDTVLFTKQKEVPVKQNTEVGQSVGFGMHIDGNEEEEEIYPPTQPGEPDTYGVMSFKQLLEGIRIPKGRSFMNVVGHRVEEEQIVDYKCVHVEIEFAELCVGNVNIFNPFISYPYKDDEIQQEAFLLDPFGRPIGYVEANGQECPLDHILALPNPKVLKYLLWCEQTMGKRPAASLYVIWGNECFKALIKWLEQYDAAPAHCDGLRELIKKRNAP